MASKRIIANNIVMTTPLSFDYDEQRRPIDASLVDYVDILFSLMGIDIDYVRFQSMTKDERKQFIRDIKINRVLKED